MSNKKKPIVHLRVYKGTQVLYDAQGNIQTPNQIVKLTHDTIEWKNFMKTLPTSGYGLAKVEKMLDGDTQEEIEISKEIAKEVDNIFKAPEKELTPEQKEIAELKKMVENLTSQPKAKGIDLLGELKKEWTLLTDAIPGKDWTVQDFQDALSDIKNTK